MQAPKDIKGSPHFRLDKCVENTVSSSETRQLRASAFRLYSQTGFFVVF